MLNTIPDHVIPHLDEHVHRLIFTCDVRDYHGIICSSCKIPIRHGWCYACLPCKLAVHKDCPGKSISEPCSIRHPKSSISEELEVQILDLKSQKLVPYGSCRSCFRCGDRCAGTIICDCSKGYSIHESCSLLPAVIQHPFHTHKLELGIPHLPEQNGCCYACRSKIRKSRWERLNEVYQCNICSDFNIHIKCALQMPMLRHSAHEHPLTLFRINWLDIDIRCNWCGQNSSDVKKSFQGYRCVPCNFYIHESCIKYSKIMFNGDEHRHPLHHILPTGGNDHGGDYEWSSGDYCEVCAKDIIKSEPIYKCLECPNEFLFHRECVFTSSQKVPEVSDDSLLLFQELCQVFANKEGNAPTPASLLLVERISESIGKIESLTLELEEDIRNLTQLRKGPP